MTRLLTLFPFIIGWHSIVLAQPKVSVTVALPAFGEYFPPAVDSIDVFPYYVREKSHEYIARRLDSSLLSRVRFVRGCLVGENVNVFTGIKYSMVYAVTVHHDLMDIYEFRIDMDGEGRILNQPELPEGRCGSHFEFAPADIVLRLARNVLNAWDDVQVKYSSRYRVPVWRFSKERRSWFRGEYIDVVLIDACSGNMLLRERIVPMR